MDVPESAANISGGDRGDRIRIGRVPIDVVNFAGAVSRIETLVDAKHGGTVFTPNVDHVVVADEDERLRAAYSRAALSVVDGMPLVWASRFMSRRLPERIAGSDLILPVLQMAARRGFRIFFLGGAPEAARGATERLRKQLPTLEVVGHDDSRIDLADVESSTPLVERIRAARPDIVFVGLGSPKQEIWSDRHAEALRPAVLIAVGASIDFLAGYVRRAPRWVSRVGLEWFYRLVQEPRRLGRRYLLRDPKFAWILAREALRRPDEAAPSSVSTSASTSVSTSASTSTEPKASP